MNASGPGPEGRSGAVAAERARAGEAIRLVQTDPHAARHLAQAAREAAQALGDAVAASMAERALGLAAHQLGDGAEATSHLRAAIRLAQRGGEAKPAAEARMSLSLILAFRGNVRGALREADQAASALRGGDAARLEMQRSAVLQALGRMDEAEAGYQRALAAFRQNGDTLWQARCLNNRGLMNTWRGRARAARADLQAARGLFEDLGHQLASADVSWNLGLAAALEGDIPGALSAYDQADDRYRQHGVTRTYLLIDRCALYLSARLIPEARETAAQAIQQLGAEGETLHRAEAQLMASQAALLDGDRPAALALAQEACAAFARQGRPGWLALARYASLQARSSSGPPSRADLAEARRTCAALEASGWALPALDARLHAAALAIALGQPEAGRQELAAASRARRPGPVELRTRAWHAEALLRLSQGDHRGAESALRAGLRILSQHRASLGATELRAHASVHSADLASVGLRLAAGTGRAERLFSWAERWRAGALLLRPARPPDDRQLAAGLAELRAIAGALESATLEGRDTRELVARQAGAEEAIRRRARLSPLGGGASGEAAPVTAQQLRAGLGERALLELVNVEGELHAVLVTAAGMTGCRLGPAAEIEHELQALRFSLRRMGRGGSLPVLAALEASAAHAAHRLDQLLLGPFGRRLGSRPLVVVPTGALHALPWSTLPSCAGRTLEVAPSATHWYRLSRGSGSPAPGPMAGPTLPRVALVAGPGLPGAASEVRALATIYPYASCLMPETSTVAGVLRKLEGAQLAHIAAHGRFRADNPLFSSLGLADGPLTVYDLEGLKAAPSWLVLSACQSGISAVRPGDELMGLSSALFATGTRALIASVIDIPDLAAEAVMVDLHRELSGGRGPADALARVQGRASGAGPEMRAASAGFVCFGTGAVTAPGGAAAPEALEEHRVGDHVRG